MTMYIELLSRNYLRFSKKVNKAENYVKWFLFRLDNLFCSCFHFEHGPEGQVAACF